MKHMWSEEELKAFIEEQGGGGGGATLDDIVDSQGNKRFVEGNGTPTTLDGFTSTYCKWSLSGSHLMLVLAGTFANRTVLANGTQIATFMLPTFILDKIYPVFSDVIEIKVIDIYAQSWSSQRLQIIEKRASYGIIFETGELTINDNRNFRIQFDLLIDTE